MLPLLRPLRPYFPPSCAASGAALATNAAMPRITVMRFIVWSPLSTRKERAQGIESALFLLRLRIALLWRVIAVNDSPVHGAIAHRRNAVSRRGLLVRRNTIDPNPAHSLRRPIRRRNSRLLLLLRRGLRDLRNWNSTRNTLGPGRGAHCCHGKSKQ